MRYLLSYCIMAKNKFEFIGTRDYNIQLGTLQVPSLASMNSKFVLCHQLVPHYIFPSLQGRENRDSAYIQPLHPYDFRVEYKLSLYVMRY